jgi:hypothetical protein
MFVIGCHRSGTSLLASIISHCLGEKRTGDLDAVVDNPRGFFESSRLREFNDNILKQCGFSWDRPPLQPLAWSFGDRIQHLIPARVLFADYTTHNTWVDKDPRLSISYGAFLHILLKPTPLAFSLRHPWAVARSLEVRDGMDQEKGLMLWLLYNRHASRYLKANDLIIHYENLLPNNGNASGDSSLKAIEQFLQQHLSANSFRASAVNNSYKNIHSLIDPNLQRSSSKELDKTKLASYCEELYKQLTESKNALNSENLYSIFDPLPGWIIDKYDQIMASGYPSLEYLRQSTYNQALAAPAADPAAEVNEKLEAANKQINEFIESQEKDRNLIAQQQQELLELKLEAASCKQQEIDSAERIKDLEYKISVLREYLNQLHKTLSWKVTAPLRWLRRGFKFKTTNPLEHN